MLQADEGYYAKTSQYTHIAKLRAKAIQGLIKATAIITMLQINPIFSFFVVCLIVACEIPCTNNFLFRDPAHQRIRKAMLIKTKYAV